MPTLRPTALTRRVRALLQERARPEVKAASEKYFLGAVPFLGVKKAGVKEVMREVRAQLKGASPETLETEGFALLLREHSEEQHVGVELLERRVRHADAGFLSRLEPVFDDAVKDWSLADAIAGHVLRPLLDDPEKREQIVGWSRAKPFWRRRVSAVAFVNEAKHGALNRDILRVCEALAGSPERFVQLGLGWLLRELGVADREAMLRFIRSHARGIQREGLRYALEKLPAAERQRMMDWHKAATRRP
jgi:3-methyladenine DNA glycosylase AlkD